MVGPYLGTWSWFEFSRLAFSWGWTLVWARKWQSWNNSKLHSNCIATSTAFQVEEASSAFPSNLATLLQPGSDLKTCPSCEVQTTKLTACHVPLLFFSLGRCMNLVYHIQLCIKYAQCLSKLWSHKLPMESFSSLHLERNNSYECTQHGPQKVLPCHLWKMLLLFGWALSHRNVVVSVGRAGHRLPVRFCKSGSGNTAEVFPHSALLGSSQKAGEEA